MTLQLHTRSLPFVAGFAATLILASSAQAAGPVVGGGGSPAPVQVSVITPPPVPPVDIPAAVFRAGDTVRPMASSPGVAAINDPGLPSKTFSLGGGNGGGGNGGGGNGGGGNGGGTGGGTDIPNNTINPTIFGNDDGQPPINPDAFGTGGGLGELAPAAGGNAAGGQGFAYIACVNNVLQNLDTLQQNDSYEKCRAIAQ